MRSPPLLPSLPTLPGRRRARSGLALGALVALGCQAAPVLPTATSGTEGLASTAPTAPATAAVRIAGSGKRAPRHVHGRLPPPPPGVVSFLPADGGPEFNRLVFESSPYLLQHCRNPVDWYPWGPEAFEKARREGKPIFLSVGYSTCHWCHVMERESFENPEVAAFLREHFVSVKVDREERPDLDELYMNATQVLTRQGGWPNSVWLTPEGLPWYAGTYFPRARFLRTLERLVKVWGERREDVERQAESLSRRLRQIAGGAVRPGSEEELESLLPTYRSQLLPGLEQNFDRVNGGFGRSPKFPPHHTLRMLTEELARDPDPRLEALLHPTLEGMLRGGIRDHLGGGFHRYATDARWFLPHFEKMLYDNALLGRVLVDAWALTARPAYRDAARELFEWVLRVMTDPVTGGFYSALDADSEGEEGRFYLWSPEQLQELLGLGEAELFASVYGLTAEGNYQEERNGRRTGRSLLYLPRPLEEAATAAGLTPAALGKRLRVARESLREVRSRRIWPGLDDKILTSWNGLMIGALARASEVLEEPRYLQAATRAADFLTGPQRPGGVLQHSYRGRSSGIPAFLDDHAFLAHGLLELHRASGEDRWLGLARQLGDVMLEEFWDPEGKSFFNTSERHEELLLRSKDPLDRALPSGNGLATQVLLALHRRTKEPRYLERARETLIAALPLIRVAPLQTQSLGLALLQLRALGPEAVLRPRETSPDLRAAPLSLRLRVGTPDLYPRQALDLQLEVEIDPGWHIQTDRPPLPSLFASGVTVQGAEGLRVEIAYPAGETLEVPFSEVPLEVWSGRIQIPLLVHPADRWPLGPGKLRLVFQTQACDDRSCQPPVTHGLPVEFRVNRDPQR